MITSICLNPVIDKIYRLNELMIGDINRPDEVGEVLAGKGVNVAKVTSLLGADIKISGFLPLEDKAIFTSTFNALNIPFEFVHVPGKLRLSLKIIDEKNASITEIIEHGSLISQDSAEQILSLIRKLAKDTNYMVFSGSLPRGLDDSFYALLIDSVKKKEVKAILDTSGNPLKKGIEAAPYMVKPNITELQQVSGESIDSDEDIIEASNRFLDYGVKVVLVSMGSKGAMFCKKNCVYKVIPPKIRPLNTVGCGDALVAGFVTSLDKDKDEKEALINATAAACASALDNEVGHLSIDDYQELKGKVTVKIL